MRLFCTFSSRLAAGLALAVLAAGLVVAADDAPPPRLANGTVIEGTIKEATGEGLAMTTPKGEKTFPWKFLSAGTRFRHEKKEGADAADTTAADSVKEPK